MSFTIPTERVTLPSKGLIYPEGHPFASGEVELRYMGAKDEDILNSEEKIRKGTAIDDLLKGLMNEEQRGAYGDLIIGDKNAVMIAARVLGLGSEYKVSIGKSSITFDLNELTNKPIDGSLINRENSFSFKMPTSGNEITFKILTHDDEKKINQELEGLKKITSGDLPRVSTQLKYVITSVNGDNTTKTIREFVDKALLTRDSLELRRYISDIMPDVDMKQTIDGEELRVPLTLRFWYP